MPSRAQHDGPTTSELPGGRSNLNQRKACFGIPDVWEEQYTKYEPQMLAIERLQKLAAELLSRPPAVATDVTGIVLALLRVTGDSMFDVLFLVGNKRGFGAIKIARSMFEAAVTSKYLVAHPNEVTDFIDFGSLKSVQHLESLKKHHPGKIPPELFTKAEAQAANVRSRFTDSKGRIRNRWSKKSIREMAEEGKLLNVYETAYSLFSDIHHLSLPGLISHETDCCEQALRVAQGSLLVATISTNDLLDQAGQDDSIREQLVVAIRDFNATPGLS